MGLIEIKMEIVQKINSRSWEEKEGKSSKPLAKISVIVIFLTQDMRRNILPKFIEICMYEDAMLEPIRMGSRIAGNQQKHLSLSFATKA